MSKAGRADRLLADGGWPIAGGGWPIAGGGWPIAGGGCSNADGVARWCEKAQARPKARSGVTWESEGVKGDIMDLENMSKIKDFRRRYLQRIGLNPNQEWPPTRQTLEAVQEAHVLRVPFENLDVFFGVPLSLDFNHLFDKIVVRQRGGFCYELNGLFAALLEDLGYGVELLAAEVPSCGDPFDHLLLRVTVPNTGEVLLSDVGFRSGSLLPLSFTEDQLQEDPKAVYQIHRYEDGLWLQRRMAADEDWQKLYRFTLDAHELGDFVPRCQGFTEDWSPFRRRPSCSVETRQGEIYLNESKLVTVVDGQLVEREVVDGRDFAHCLLTVFGLVPGALTMSRPVTQEDQIWEVPDVVALEQQLASEGTSLLTLMQRAGNALAQVVANVAESANMAKTDQGACAVPVADGSLVVVLAGTGNNGGDGWVAAQRLTDCGVPTVLVCPKAAADLRAEPARTAALDAERAIHVEIMPSAERLKALLESANVVVDCLLGTGFAPGQVREPYRSWIELANTVCTHTPMIAADVPSADAVCADAAVVMLRNKAMRDTGVTLLADLA